MEEDIVMQLECSCGCVFEPENEETDDAGDRWVQCPKCNARIPVPEPR